MRRAPISVRFAQHGFVVLEDAIAPDSVGALRKRMESLFEVSSEYTDDGPQARSDLFCRYPDLRWLLTVPSITRTMSEIAGPAWGYLHEPVAHASYYAPWHKETTAPERSGATFHKLAEFLMVKVGIYLQDNGASGGGLDVAPGSHLLEDCFVAHPEHSSPPTPWITLATRAGDAVIWDWRLYHRATPGSRATSPRKFGIFLSCGRPNRAVDEYLIWARQGHLAWQATHAYPSELLDYVRINQVRLI